MSHNAGTTSLKKKRRPGDAMSAYDGLPAPLRRWLAQAALPWSPASARRIWSKSLAQGQTPEEAVLSLIEAESRTLARDRSSAAQVSKL